ncbi:alpha/beta fold hydrolase [Robiginitalea sp. SC105]|uniref:alpha/beta fold hydrolase n=1 Tax=Robiginitalea sp. SC105 TaxID=2762332 RepID=UPI00163A48AE|nr:alpha/beta fold hydrolase [Robiginitalea sp. SC105]MBC2840436.1 lysophospholipase [Robiginitalea sp. SC105]
MEYVKKEFKAEWAGVQVYGFHAAPDSPGGCIVLVHGFGEHSGRYESSVVPQILQAGWAVLAFDLVGHGRSGGRRGHCAGYLQLLEQVQAACRRARETFPGKALVVYGHSMGGNLVLNLVLRGMESPAGIVASSPYLRLAFKPPAWKWQLGKFFLKVAPGITLPSGLDPSGISSLAEEVRAYQEDPLVHDRVSPNYSFPVIEAGAWALEHANALEVPLLIAHGSDDPIIDPEGSQLMHQRVPDSRLLMLPGNFHELHHDRGREELFRTLTDWLAALAEKQGTRE